MPLKAYAPSRPNLSLPAGTVMASRNPIVACRPRTRGAGSVIFSAVQASSGAPGSPPVTWLTWIGWLAGHKGQWDLSVVDLFLRQGNGLAVVNWCNGRAPHQRVVVLTNYAREDARQRCLDAGADRDFDKSIELDEFFEFCET